VIRQKSNLDHFPVVKFSDEFQEVYGRSVMAFSEVVHEMARNGDSAAVQETITALCWVFCRSPRDRPAAAEGETELKWR